MLAPDIIGWFCLVYGNIAIASGMLLSVLMSIYGWRYLDRRYLRSGPVVQVFFLWMMFITLTESTLDSISYMLVVGVAAIGVFEVTIRLIDRIEKPMWT